MSLNPSEDIRSVTDLKRKTKEILNQVRRKKTRSPHGQRQIETLETFPERCPLVPENEMLGTRYRHLRYGNYRTMFRIAGKTAYVLRVIHGARLLDTSMFEG